MPNIKPISDLRNYSEVLRDVSVGAPVFLTKNGRGRYAIVDMRDFEKMQATETNWIQYVRIIYHSQDIVISCSGFLFCRHIFM